MKIPGRMLTGQLFLPKMIQNSGHYLWDLLVSLQAGARDNNRKVKDNFK